jgi:hypothetical protein
MCQSTNPELPSTNRTRASDFIIPHLPHLDLAGMVLLRQGLWIEDGQTPPGQECSNGSLILFAVVSWRTSFVPA